MKPKTTIHDFALLLHKLLRSDRDINIGTGGMTGEGKSTFTTKLLKEYCKIAGLTWSFQMMTWDRDEMMTWIDGEKGSPIDPITGLKKKQLPEYSPINPDELFHMFYRRNWWQDGQIEAISTFNMCRDRHLLIAGNIPNFWKLDGAFTERIRFYAYIPKRGKAWIFQQENNPFASDQWNQNENSKMFRKMRNPYKCPNFLFEIDFEDWEEQEKIDYLKIRNVKRVKALQKTPVKKKNHKYMLQRNMLIVYMVNTLGVSQKETAKALHLKPQAINYLVQKDKNTKAKGDITE